MAILENRVQQRWHTSFLDFSPRMETSRFNSRCDVTGAEGVEEGRREGRRRSRAERGRERQVARRERRRQDADPMTSSLFRCPAPPSRPTCDARPAILNPWGGEHDRGLCNYTTRYTSGIRARRRTRPLTTAARASIDVIVFMSSRHTANGRERHAASVRRSCLEHP